MKPNEKMHLKAIFSAVLLSVAMYGGYQTYQQLTTANAQFLVTYNLEALAGSESLGGGFYTNFKSSTVWYNSSISGGVTYSEKPGFWVSGTWVSVVCCVDGTDKEACCFNGEKSACAERVTRSARS